MNQSFKNHLLLLLLFRFLPGAIFAQASGAMVVERQVASALLQKEATLLLRLPDTYNAAQKRYAVLYLLHGSKQAVEEIASICRDMHLHEGIPEMIVVGVDLSDEKLDRMGDPGKYDRFLSCMEQELMPEIGKQYRTNGRSILYEKSLEGSFALYALLTKPKLFNGYIAASKQWYEDNNDYFTGLANKALKNPAPFKSRKIFLATLNGAYNNNNIPEVDKQMQAFSASLISKSGNRISAKYQAFDDWGITPQPGFKEGLLFVSLKGKPAKPEKTQPTMLQTSNGKWVILDSKKKTLYEVFLYDNGPDYPSEGLFRIVQNGKIGYADEKTFAIVISPRFDCAYPFENGKAKVSTQCKTVRTGEHYSWESEHWQYVDKKGQLSQE